MIGKHQSRCGENCEKREHVITKMMNTYKAPLTSRNYHKELTLQLFQSPIHSGSKLGKYVPIMTRDTLYNKLIYRPHNKYNDAIREKNAIIKMLVRRLHMTSPQDTRYTIIQQQLESLNKQVAQLTAQKNDLFAKRDELLRYATENAGNVVPIDAIRQVMTGKLSPREALIPSTERYVDQLGEGIESDEGASEMPVKAFSTGPLGGDADIKQEQDEAPEGQENNAPPESGAVESVAGAPATESVAVGKSIQAETPSKPPYESETGSESEAEPEIHAELPKEAKGAMYDSPSETEPEMPTQRRRETIEPISESDEQLMTPENTNKIDLGESDYPAKEVLQDSKMFEKYKEKFDSGKKLTPLQARDYIRIIKKYAKASGITHSELEKEIETHQTTAEKPTRTLTQEQKDRKNELAKIRRRRKREAQQNAKSLEFETE